MRGAGRQGLGIERKAADLAAERVEHGKAGLRHLDADAVARQDGDAEGAVGRRHCSFPFCERGPKLTAEQQRHARRSTKERSPSAFMLLQRQHEDLCTKLFLSCPRRMASMQSAERCIGKEGVSKCR